MEPRDHSRGYLLHWERPGRVQFITWRLADSLPADVAQSYHDQRAQGGASTAGAFLKVERCLDRGLGACTLRHPLAARCVMETLFSAQGSSYRLLEFVVMPNHVHALLHIHARSELSDALRAVKGASSREINRLLGRCGRLWQPDYFDRLIRSQDHFDRASNYIWWNPVKAGLCAHPAHYAYSSANPVVRDRLAAD